MVTHLLLILGSIVMLFPFLWMILSSFKTVGEQMSIPMKILPGSFGYLENYKQALEAVPFLRLYLNTILMILGRVICAVIFSSMAGYGFARMTVEYDRTGNSTVRVFDENNHETMKKSLHVNEIIQ